VRQRFSHPDPRIIDQVTVEGTRQELVDFVDSSRLTDSLLHNRKIKRIILEVKE
jgi:hypothetical protein